jgi:hypothetical protein
MYYADAEGNYYLVNHMTNEKSKEATWKNSSRHFQMRVVRCEMRDKVSPFR